MKTVHQMKLGECRLECERQAERANYAERNLRFILSELSKPYSDVVELEIRVKSLLSTFGNG